MNNRKLVVSCPIKPQILVGGLVLLTIRGTRKPPSWNLTSKFAAAVDKFRLI